jgi:dihydropteroate synthase
LAILHSKGKTLDISSPVVMGILNATPNSFYNKGQESDVDGLLRTAEKMVNDGAEILDIGGASTKPGQELIGVDEELSRIMPVVSAIHSRFPDVWLSVDTYHARAAKMAVGAGVSIVNDISAGAFDKDMFSTVAALKVPYIAMHIQGTPKTMQLEPSYGDVVTEVYDALAAICDECAASGLQDVVIDPGFGFGKTVAHNFQLLQSLGTFHKLGKPILVGLSRKSMVCRPLKVTPENALNGTTALNTLALLQGANIIRVHDVKEAMEAITLVNYYNNPTL